MFHVSKGKIMHMFMLKNKNKTKQNKIEFPLQHAWNLGILEHVLRVNAHSNFMQSSCPVHAQIMVMNKNVQRRLFLSSCG